MPQTNQRISEYLLDAKVGAGTFGEVWSAHHHVWADQRVAIKIPTDPAYVRQLQAEGKSVQGLTHANIVRAMGFDPYANPPYLIMEYVPGTNLRSKIKRGGLPIDQVLAIMGQVLAGLGHANAQGIVHRDLKPENILVHERADKEGFATPGVVKITDFGFGKAATAAAGSIVYSASLNDKAGQQLAGTLDYMSPEQRSGGEIDKRSDLYACGVILHELLTGERPAGTECPSDIRKDGPKYLDEVFKRSYARLDKRFTSAEEFAAALRPGNKANIPTPVAAAAATPKKPQLFNRTMCPKCQSGVEASDQFCTQCGTQLVDVVRRCGSCGGYPDTNDRFCIFCGKPLAGTLRIA